MKAIVSWLATRAAVLHEVAVVPAAVTHRSMSLGRQLTPFAFRLASDVKCGVVDEPVQPVIRMATA